MPKRRTDADHRRFFDEFECVKIPRLQQAMGVVQPRRAARDHPSWRQAEADRLGARPVQERRVLVASFQMPDMRTQEPTAFGSSRTGRSGRRCCVRMGIVHRSKWGFRQGMNVSRARDQKLDELIAKLDATTGPLRFNPASNIGAAKRSSSGNSRAGSPRACDALADRLSPRHARIAAGRQTGR